MVDYAITDVNPQYEAIIGLSRDQVVGRKGSDVYGVTPAPYLAEFSSAPLTGRPVRFETYFAPLEKHFSISVAPLGPNGFATIFFDITAMKRSQEEHQTLSALVESSNEFTGLASLDGRVFYLNEAGRRLAGLDRDQSLDGLSIFDFVPPAERGWLAEHVLPAVRSRGAWTGQGALQNQKTGAPLRVDCDVFVIPSRETGQPLCLAAVMHDVTERERAREQRERLEEQLQQAQKMESVGRLAGGVAHDFNNLLTVILGNLESVLDALNPADPIYQPLTEVQRAGESAASLTRQLLAFSRKQIIAPTTIDLNALIGAMERMLRRIIGEDVTLDARTAPGLSRVHADASQLEQIIVNLSVNARDAMPGGGRLVIETADVVVSDEICRTNPAARPGRFVRLAVTDTGAGMTDEEKEKAFEPFFTTKAKGTGLGLAMVYGAVSQHNGFVGLTSDIGRGTTVEIFLPAVSSPEAESAADAADSPGTGAETILLVEDEPLVRELTERALERHGYRVLACSDGASALAAAEAFTGADSPADDRRRHARHERPRAGLAPRGDQARNADALRVRASERRRVAARPARAWPAVHREAVHAAHARREGARRPRRGLSVRARPSRAGRSDAGGEMAVVARFGASELRFGRPHSRSSCRPGPRLPLPVPADRRRRWRATRAPARVTPSVFYLLSSDSEF